MKSVSFETPALFGDHHVTEVRRILLELPGIIEVEASSAFQVVDVTYDPEKINDLEIAMKLDQAGYLGEWTFPIEAAPQHIMVPLARNPTSGTQQPTNKPNLMLTLPKMLPIWAAPSGLAQVWG